MFVQKTQQLEYYGFQKKNPYINKQIQCGECKVVLNQRSKNACT